MHKVCSIVSRTWDVLNKWQLLLCKILQIGFYNWMDLGGAVKRWWSRKEGKNLLHLHKVIKWLQQFNQPWKRPENSRKDHLHLVRKSRGKWQGCDWLGPKLFPHPSHRQKGEEQNGEGINAQEPGPPGPGDLLQEYESTFHWALMINRAGHQGQLEHSEGLRLL